MVSQTIDLTTSFNESGVFNLDLSGWDYAVIHLITPAATVSFLGSNDAGAIEGVSDGNGLTAINFTAMGLINLATGTLVTSSASSGIFKLNVGTRFLQLSGTTAAKVIMYLTKIG